MSAGAEPARPREYIRSVERALALLRAFSELSPGPGVTDLAAATGMSRATTRRFLITLVELGYVRTDGRSFRLTPRVLQLGLGFLSGLSFTDVVLPHLRRLVDDVDEAAEAAVLDGHDVVYVAHVPSTAIMTVNIDIGRRLPAHATATGKALLAALPHAELEDYLATARLEAVTARTIADPGALRAELARVRADGYAVVDQELVDGILAVATCVRDGSGRPVGAINLATHALRRTPEALRDELAAPLCRTARDISADLAARG